MGSFMDLVDTEEHIALLGPNMYLSSALLKWIQFSGQGVLDKASALPCYRPALCSTLNSYWDSSSNHRAIWPSGLLKFLKKPGERTMVYSYFEWSTIQVMVEVFYGLNYSQKFSTSDTIAYFSGTKLLFFAILFLG